MPETRQSARSANRKAERFPFDPMLRLRQLRLNASTACKNFPPLRKYRANRFAGRAAHFPLIRRGELKATYSSIRAHRSVRLSSFAGVHRLPPREVSYAAGNQMQRLRRYPEKDLGAIILNCGVGT